MVSASRWWKIDCARAALALAGVLSVVGVAACGGGDGGGSTATGSTPAASTSAASTASASTGKTATASETAAGTLPDATQEGGNVRIVLSAESNLDPITGPRIGRPRWSPMIEQIVNFDDEGLSKDGIVTDWKRTNDKTWVFTIRDGVKFHDGTPVDADQVAKSILLNKDTTGALLSTYYTNITSIKATGPTTFEVKTKTPQYNIPYVLSTAYLIPAAYYKKVGTKGFNAKPIGTGPFKLKSIRPGQDMVVVRNPDYWGEKPKADQLTFTYSPDAAQRLALVRTGAADLAYDLPPAQADEAKGANVQLLSVPTVLKVMLWQVADQAPLKDANLRKAIALAINRDQIVDGVLGGHAQADGGFLNMLPSRKSRDVVNQNIDEAKRLVGSSSPEVPLTFPSDAFPNASDVAEAIGGQLAKVGIKVKLQPSDYVSQLGKMVKQQLNGAFLLPVTPNFPAPGAFAGGSIASTSPVKSCPDPTSDKLTSDALLQKDDAAAAAVYEDLNTHVVADLACFVPLYFQTQNIAASPKLGGFHYSQLTVPVYNKIGFIAGK